MFSDDEGEAEVTGQPSAQQLSRVSFSSTISGLLDSVFRYSTVQYSYSTVTKWIIGSAERQLYRFSMQSICRSVNTMSLYVSM